MGKLDSNPFSTRFIRPGAIAYRFPAGQNVEGLVQRLADLNWQGALIGPHGTGKSTLIAEMLPAIEQSGRSPQVVQLHTGERQLPPDFDADQLTPQSVLVIDGYEQLGWWARLRISRMGARVHCGLLVTAHGPVALPTLATLAPSLSALQEIVAELQQGHPPFVGPGDVAERFAVRQGNMRETLFDLYDLYEQRRL